MLEPVALGATKMLDQAQRRLARWHDRSSQRVLAEAVHDRQHARALGIEKGRQILSHQPQVGLGGRSHNHSVAGQATPLNQATSGTARP